jgi:hypothetical protein
VLVKIYSAQVKNGKNLWKFKKLYIFTVHIFLQLLIPKTSSFLQFQNEMKGGGFTYRFQIVYWENAILYRKGFKEKIIQKSYLNYNKIII